jgi:proline iminopeptidase
MTSSVPTNRQRFWLLLAALLVVGAAYLYVTRWGSTPDFRDEAGRPLPGSVAEMQRVGLGGVQQSITIRGEDATAPILIWLHGGPGMDATGMWRRNNAALEEKFVVVYWTQRGTGRSYSDGIAPTSMTLDQFVSDLDELVDLLTARFGAKRVVLAGHSWGTNVGVAYARAHPEKVAAYIGVSQVVGAVEGERRSYEFALGEAQHRSNAKAISELEDIGPPPYDTDSMLLQRKWLGEFGGVWHTPRSLPQLMWESFGASEMTLLDGYHFWRGSEFSLSALEKDINAVNWLRDAPAFEVPVFFAAGRHDRNTDADLQHEYFEEITAPSKHFEWFENSAHSPPFEEPEAFNAFVIRDVLPVAKARAN